MGVIKRATSKEIKNAFEVNDDLRNREVSAEKQWVGNHTYGMTSLQEFMKCTTKTKCKNETIQT